MRKVMHIFFLTAFSRFFLIFQYFVSKRKEVYNSHNFQNVKSLIPIFLSTRHQKLQGLLGDAAILLMLQIKDMKPFVQIFEQRRNSIEYLILTLASKKLLQIQNFLEGLTCMKKNCRFLSLIEMRFETHSRRTHAIYNILSVV